MIKIGVIGYGYWGPNLVRNFSETSDAQVVMVSDLSSDRLAAVQRRYPAIRTTTDFRDLLKAPDVDAVVIATPVDSHFDLAIAALQAGKHVLVEKPLADTSERVLRLIEESSRRKRVLMVDHTFVYNPAVRKIKEHVAAGSLGEMCYFDSVRINLGLFQRDVDVFWDLAVHDLSIMDYILPMKPDSVSATGISHVPGEPENTGYLTLFFPGSLIAHINVSWLAPVKIRRMLIGGSIKMIVYDDLEPSEKVKIYDKGITLTSKEQNIYKMLIGYRLGDMLAPQLELTEPLRVEAKHFIQCMEGREQPMADGSAGYRVVRILEAASRSMKRKGAPEQLNLKGV